MSEHTPHVVDTMAADCLDYDCEHEDPSECPYTPMVVCEGCEDTDADDWTPVIEWPCVFATRGPLDDAVKAKLLADYGRDSR